MCDYREDRVFVGRLAVYTQTLTLAAGDFEPGSARERDLARLVAAGPCVAVLAVGSDHYRVLGVRYDALGRLEAVGMSLVRGSASQGDLELTSGPERRLTFQAQAPNPGLDMVPYPRTAPPTQPRYSVWGQADQAWGVGGDAWQYIAPATGPTTIVQPQTA